MPLDAEQRRTRATLAAHARYRTAPADPRAAEAGRAMRAGSLERHIRSVVDGWPPLTAEQREQLALLLHPGAGNVPAA